MTLYLIYFFAATFLKDVERIVDFLYIKVDCRGRCESILQYFFRPGSGAAVDFFKAGKDFYYGNYSGATLNLFFGSLDLATYGFSTALKDVAQKSGKDAVIQAAKEKAQTDGKKLVGRKVAEGLAKGGVEQTVNEVKLGDPRS